MAASSVKVKGLRELQRDLGKIDKQLRRDLQREMSDVAKVVSDEAAGYLSRRYGDPVGRKIRPRVRGASAFAESRARSKHVRPHFGALVMTALLVARAKKQNDVVDKLDDMIDRLADSNGFGRGLL